MTDIYDALKAKLGPLRLPRRYCPYDPHPKQEWFLRRDELEAFFGGAAGPGKSWALLMAALQYVDVPGYNALILRPELQEFYKPKALIPVSQNWLGPTDAHWNGSLRQWTFPSGATLSFGYLRSLADLAHYKGPAYAFVGFDELTEFAEQLYRGMSRVLRDPPPLGSGTVPLRKRAASNPGGPGHGWVKTRFVVPASRPDGVIYVPATIHDNPSMNYEEYLLSLAHLDPVDRERLIKGDWDVMEEGGKFSREDFIIVDPGEAPRPVAEVRYWDLAASEPSPAYPDPDYTVGLRLSLDADGGFTVRHIIRGQWAEGAIERNVRATAEADGRAIPVYIEQEPGASGKIVVSHYKRTVLRGYACYAGLTRGQSKEVRARPVAAAVSNHLVRVIRGEYTNALLDEAVLFPMEGVHDDIVDALSGAHTKLTSSGRGGGGGISIPRGRIPAGGSITR